MFYFKKMPGNKNSQVLKSLVLNLMPAFTLIELLVVMSIMVLLAAAFTINLAGQRSSRDLNIAQNELISNLRKIQSSTLSSRLLPSGKTAQYYLLKIDLTKPTQYTILGLYNVTSQPALETVETIKLPPNIQFASGTSSSIIIINRQQNPLVQGLTSTDCALIAFAAPFGKIIFNDGCTASSPLQLSDDYYSNIINFQNNISCPTYPPSSAFAACKASTDSTFTVTLTNLERTLFKSVSVNSITGAVNFSN